MKTGRPTKFLPKHCQMLIDHMSSGYSFESFSAEIDVDRDTLYHWCKIHPMFSDAKKKAVEKCRLHWEKLGVAGMVGKLKGFNAAIWIFSMKNRFGWADRVIMEGNEEKPIALAYDPSALKRRE